MGRPTEAQKAAKAHLNGTAPKSPEFTAEELNLYHQLLGQASFPAESWEMARVAHGARLKIEAWVQNGQPE